MAERFVGVADVLLYGRMDATDCKRMCILSQATDQKDAVLLGDGDQVSSSGVCVLRQGASSAHSAYEKRMDVINKYVSDI